MNKMSVISKTNSFIVLAMVLSAASGGAIATEGNGNSYPLGVETNYSGIVTPEGLTTFVYYSNYSATHSKNNSGTDNPALAKYDANINTVSVRLSYVWPNVKFFGANVETRAAQAFPSINLTLDVARPAPLAPLHRGGNEMGLADLSFAPVILGWHSPTLHQATGIETFLPTGSYEATRLVNTGRNYYQVAPFYAVTWLPAQGVEVSAKFRYAINGKNNATNYQSGNEATLEFGTSYQVSSNWVIGLNGYMYQQTTDDLQNGNSVNGHGNRGRVKALGPMVSYNFTPGFKVIAKLQEEFGAVNKSEGTRFWLQAKMPF